MKIQDSSGKPLYSLIPLEDFKILMGVDDREDKICRFCLLTATYSIEQYCKRRFLRKKHTDYHTFIGDHIFTLREYPLRKIHTVQAVREQSVVRGDMLFGPDSIINPELYYTIPDSGINEDIPFSLVLRPPLSFSPHKIMYKVQYSAGYNAGKVPPDLASACLELASWNMNRYRGRRIGMTGSVRGKGRDGEHFELSMPENIKSLLEPYRRRII
jgi:hypothetical protein